MAKPSLDKLMMCSTVVCFVCFVSLGCGLSQQKVQRCHRQSSSLTRVRWPISSWCSRGALLSLCHSNMSSWHCSRRGRRGQRPLLYKGEQRINPAPAKRLLSPHLHLRTSKLTRHVKGAHAVQDAITWESAQDVVMEGIVGSALYILIVTCLEV